MTWSWRARQVLLEHERPHTVSSTLRYSYLGPRQIAKPTQGMPTRRLGRDTDTHSSIHNMIRHIIYTIVCRASGGSVYVPTCPPLSITLEKCMRKSDRRIQSGVGGEVRYWFGILELYTATISRNIISRCPSVVLWAWKSGITSGLRMGNWSVLVILGWRSYYSG